MNLLVALSNGPVFFTGGGINHEGENFLGRMEIRKLVGGKGILLHYTATRDDGILVHEESTLLSTNDKQDLCLWPVMEELPFVLPHPELSSSVRENGTLVVVFASAPRSFTEVFREEITFESNQDGSISYSHAWGMPGGSFEARSSCKLAPSEA